MKIIRLWRLGYIDPEGKSTILPTKESIARLIELIDRQSKREDGIMDIVWGPELSLDVLVHEDCEDEIMDVVQILGDEICES